MAEFNEESFNRFTEQAAERVRHLLPESPASELLASTFGGALFVIVKTVQEMSLVKVPNAIAFDVSGYAIGVSRPGAKNFTQLFLASENRAHRAIALAEELFETGRLDEEGLQSLRSALGVNHG